MNRTIDEMNAERLSPTLDQAVRNGWNEYRKSPYIDWNSTPNYGAEYDAVAERRENRTA